MWPRPVPPLQQQSEGKHRTGPTVCRGHRCVLVLAPPPPHPHPKIFRLAHFLSGKEVGRRAGHWASRGDGDVTAVKERQDCCTENTEK